MTIEINRTRFTFQIRTVKRQPKGPEDLPVWNYDGSSTGQAPGHDSEVGIRCENPKWF